MLNSVHQDSGALLDARQRHRTTLPRCTIAIQQLLGWERLPLMCATISNSINR
jgi:hypothetical protein